MARQKSVWKVTFDPGGAHELVLCNFGDWLAEIPKTSGTNRVDSSEPLEAESAENFPTGLVNRTKSFMVFKDHGSFHAAADYAERIDTLLPLDVVAPLEVEVQGGSKTRYANAAFLNWESGMVKGGTFQTLTQFTFKCGKATAA